MNIPMNRKAASLILKCVVIISASVGTYLSAFGESRGFMLGRTAFMYFTIQSNILIALICAVGAVLLLRNKAVKNAWFIIKFIGTVSITLTGAVFCFVLAPTLGDFAWQIQNILTHVAVPAAAIADFFVTGVYGSFRKRHVPFALLPPLAYVVYAVAAYTAGWTFADGNTYPYFFFNWGGPAGAFGFMGEFPFMGCVWWLLALSLTVLAVGYVYMRIVNKMKRKAAVKKGSDFLSG